jgi:hypothetical protein
MTEIMKSENISELSLEEMDSINGGLEPVTVGTAVTILAVGVVGYLAIQAAAGVIDGFRGRPNQSH